MGINKNHEVEEINGIRCAVVERNVPEARVAFLKNILIYNHYEVVVAESAPPKAKAATDQGPASDTVQADAAKTFTIGVTNLLFNPINAVYGRALKAPNSRHFVTPSFWDQTSPYPQDEVPYFTKNH